MKFLAIGKHGEVDPNAKVTPGGVSASLEWLERSLQAGIIDCAYSMEGGGRLLIAEAPSAGVLLQTLRDAPDVQREWIITGLTDAQDSIRQYVAEHS
jgi:hypothetical protein